jgi:DNA-binding IclR family transcriptional regulator
MTPPKRPERNTIKSAEKLFRIVDTLVELEGAGVTELADHLGLPKSSVHNYLQTMVHGGYAVKKGETYHAGLRFLTIGGHLREQDEAFQLSRPIVEDLAEQTNERAQFIVEENGRGIFIHRAAGERAIDAGTRIGKRIWLHSTGAGKAILAHMGRVAKSSRVQ